MLNRDPATWPPFPGPDAPEAVRLRWAVERFLPPETRTLPAPSPTFSSPPPPAEAPAAPRGADPAELGRVLGLPLDQLDRVLRVVVPWLDVPLWFVPSEAAAEALVTAGQATRGAVWTRRELIDLLAVPGFAKASVRTVALAKLAVAGEVAEVRAAGSLPDRGSTS